MARPVQHDNKTISVDLYLYSKRSNVANNDWTHKDKVEDSELTTTFEDFKLQHACYTLTTGRALMQRQKVITCTT